MKAATFLLTYGKTIRILNVIDIYSREYLQVDVSSSFPSEKVIENLEGIMKKKGIPKAIRLDNGSEYISRSFFKWANEKGINLYYISRP